MTKDIKDTMGAANMEGTDAIIYQLRSSFEAMDNNFNSMKMRIDELETNLTETVVKAKDD